MCVCVRGSNSKMKVVTEAQVVGVDTMPSEQELLLVHTPTYESSILVTACLCLSACLNSLRGR